jgi:hypothetical protein
MNETKQEAVDFSFTAENLIRQLEENIYKDLLTSLQGPSGEFSKTDLETMHMLNVLKNLINKFRIIIIRAGTIGNWGRRLTLGDVRRLRLYLNWLKDKLERPTSYDDLQTPLFHTVCHVDSLLEPWKEELESENQKYIYFSNFK